MSGFIKDNFKNIIKNNKTSCISTLGCGLPGVAPTLIGGGAGAYNQSSGMDGANGRSMNRKILRQSFGNRAYIPFGNSKVSPMYYKNKGQTQITPFRAAMNAGDVNGTVNESTNPIFGTPANQVTGINPSFSSQALAGYKGLAGNIQTSGNSAYTGNPRYVYDGSDYVRFKKLNSINNNYNDKSFGSDQHQASQSALRRVRRY